MDSPSCTLTSAKLYYTPLTASDPGRGLLLNCRLHSKCGTVCPCEARGIRRNVLGYHKITAYSGHKVLLRSTELHAADPGRASSRK
jgi:hypothetical protein